MNLDISKTNESCIFQCIHTGTKVIHQWTVLQITTTTNELYYHDSMKILQKCTQNQLLIQRYMDKNLLRFNKTTQLTSIYIIGTTKYVGKSSFTN